MKKTTSVYKITAAALLIAVGILIPMISPVKIPFPPDGSFTLASHVAVMLAMFISPLTAAAVALGTTLGFFLGGFPLPIVLRAATHLIFAIVGSLILKKRPQILAGSFKTVLFAFVIAVIHAICEVMAVTLFYTLGGAGISYFNKDYIMAVIWSIGVVTLVHSMIDFSIAWIIYKPLIKIKEMKMLFIS